MAIKITQTTKPLKLKGKPVVSGPLYGKTIKTTILHPANNIVVKKKAAVAPALNISSLIRSYQASLPTAKQQQTQASQSVNSQIQQALSGIQATTAEQVRAANRQSERAQGFAEGLRTLSPEMGAQIQSYYNDAANQLGNFGTGLTGAVADAQQADATQAAQQVAQQSGGQGTVTGYSVPDLRNTAQYTGVALPAATLVGQGANQAANTFLQNVANSQSIGNIAQGYVQQANDATTSLADQRAQLELTRPGLMQTALNSLKSDNRQDVATLISALALQGTNAQIPSKIANTIADTSGKKATTAATKTGTKVKVATATGTTPSGKAPAPGNYWSSPNPKTRVAEPIPPHQKLDPNDPTHSKTIADPNNPPSGFKYDPKSGTFVANKTTSTTGLNPNGTLASGYWRPGPGATPQKVPSGYYPDPTNPYKLIAVPPRKSTAKGPTASQVSSIINRGRSEMSKTILGPPYSKKVDIYNPEGPSYQPTLPLATARSRLLKAYFPRGLWKNSQVLGVINDALATAGYKV